MAHSSTSYRSQWKLGKTTVIRVPQKLAPALLRYARELDQKTVATNTISSTAFPKLREQTSGLRTAGVQPGSASAPNSEKRKKTTLCCDIRATFATAFKNWRLRARIPLKQLAGDLGLSPATISAWELGKRFPTDRHFELLMEYTGLPPCRLFCVMADKCVPVECLLAVPQKP
jgi:DNA-binding transcriptional regulator YiaG